MNKRTADIALSIVWIVAAIACKYQGNEMGCLACLIISAVWAK